ncbi:alpha/beta hydrolase [Streptococcus pluranimalium]|uniref:alpha/beta hydrolase n=1 Tax=Streptococcus pluranimalium TaxID=82348 RepID=UPI0039FBF9AC
MKKYLNHLLCQKRWQKVAIGILGIFLMFCLVPQAYAVYQEHQQLKLKESWLDQGGIVRRNIYQETVDTIDGIIESPVDELNIAFRVFKVDKPKGIIQIVHGAGEYKDYYYDFTQFLVEHGYAVILSDNRGHGYSIDANNPSGYVSSIDDIVADQYAITRYIKEIYPDIPMTLYGHSFGSVIVRNYMMLHDEEIDKLIMEGTSHFIPMSKFGVFLGNIETFWRNPRASGGLLSFLCTF